MKLVLRLPALLISALVLLFGCGDPSGPVASNPAPMASGDINLIFVVSEEGNNNESGDINPATANLTSQSLQRTLLMGSYLQKTVLGNQNVTSIYALEPMTHLENTYPDLVALETVQQFALLNVATLDESPAGPALVAANSFPINVGYSTGQLVTYRQIRKPNRLEERSGPDQSRRQIEQIYK